MAEKSLLNQHLPKITKWVALAAIAGTAWGTLRGEVKANTEGRHKADSNLECTDRKVDAVLLELQRHTVYLEWMQERFSTRYGWRSPDDSND